MVLKQLEDAMLLKKAQQREQFLSEMEAVLDGAKKEKRAFTEEENKKFENLEKKVRELDEELAKADTNKEELEKRIAERNARIEANKNASTSQQFKDVKRRSDNPMEVRGYRREERVGRHDTDVTIGDLIVSHITGKYRNSEVREAMNTTGTGNLVIPANIFSNYIDRLRDNSILGEVTTYPMDSKTLTIPKVISDIVPEFKIENELAKETTPIFDSVVLEAKHLYAYCPISLELVESSNLDMGAVITELMSKAMGDAIQKFMLNGAVNGYEGVFNSSGVGINGAVNYATIAELMGYVKYNRGVPNSIVMNSEDAMALQLLQDNTGQYVQAPEFMRDLRKHELSGDTLPMGMALIGDLSSIAFGVLSSGGLQIEISRTAGEAFQRGQIVVRARLSGDFAVTNRGLLATVQPGS